MLSVDKEEYQSKQSSKNDVVWADSRSDANKCGDLHETRKYPISVMVALGVTWNGMTRP